MPEESNSPELYQTLETQTEVRNNSNTHSVSSLLTYSLFSHHQIGQLNNTKDTQNIDHPNTQTKRNIALFVEKAPKRKLDDDDLGYEEKKATKRSK